MPGNRNTRQEGQAKPLVAPEMAKEDRWAVWRPIQRNGRLTKPPLQARNPRIPADISKPETWSDYATAVKTVEAGRADGITYRITKDGRITVIDLDNCRNQEHGRDCRVGPANSQTQAGPEYAQRNFPV